jgi:hypothetical protein
VGDRFVPDRNKVFFGVGLQDDISREINYAKDEALKEIARSIDTGVPTTGVQPPSFTTGTSTPSIVTSMGYITPVTGFPFNGIIGDKFTVTDVQTTVGTGHTCAAIWTAMDYRNELGYGLSTVIAYKSEDVSGTDVYKFIAHCTSTGISYDLGSPVATTTALGATATREYQFAYGGTSIATLTSPGSKSLYLFTKTGGWTTTAVASGAAGTTFNSVSYATTKFTATPSTAQDNGGFVQINTSATHYYRVGDPVQIETDILDSVSSSVIVPAGFYEVTLTPSTTSFVINYASPVGLGGATSVTGGASNNSRGTYWAGTSAGGYAIYDTNGTLVMASATALGNTSLRAGGRYVWLNNGYVGPATPFPAFVARYAFSIGMNNNLVSVGTDGFLTHVLEFTSAGITTWGWRRYDPATTSTVVQTTLFTTSGLAADGEPWGSNRTGGTLAANHSLGIVHIRGGDGVVYIAGFLGYQAYQDPITGLPSLPITSGPATWVHDGVSYNMLNAATVDQVLTITPGIANAGSVLFSGVDVFETTGSYDDGLMVIGGTKVGTGAAEWCTVSAAELTLT